jgi:hypothetical protein
MKFFTAIVAVISLVAVTLAGNVVTVKCCGNGADQTQHQNQGPTKTTATAAPKATGAQQQHAPKKRFWLKCSICNGSPDQVQQQGIALYFLTLPAPPKKTATATTTKASVKTPVETPVSQPKEVPEVKEESV